MDGFWLRLKQRKLVQWAAAYVAAAFAFIQVLDVVVQRFGWPDRIEKVIILVLAVGFFVALVLAWYHGERGAQRVGGTELVIIALLLAIGGGALWAYARAPAVPAAAGAAKTASPLQVAKPPSLLAAVTTDIPAKSVAVLPFANDSGNHDEQYFSDGLSEDLINALSQFAGLKVISRNSAFQFRNSKDSSAEIGKLLGVAHLLEGSVQRAGGEVRITATLVNASDGTVLWSQRYDKPYKDLFALQDAITQAVADALKAKLMTAPGAVVQSDRPPSGNLDAYAAYLRGRSEVLQGSEQSVHRAVADYGQAIRLDPHYARAYAEQGRTWAWIAVNLGGVAQQQAYDKARSAIDKALRLNPDLAEGYTARSYLESYGELDWKAGRVDLQHALQLAPGDGDAKSQLGALFAGLGQVSRAISLTQEALVTDPRDSGAYYWLSQFLSARGRLDAARRAIRTVIALQPRGAAGHAQLARIEIQRGDAKAALAAAQQESSSARREIAVTLSLQIGSDRAAADAALKKLIRDQANVAAYQIAEVYALRGDPDDTFKWLDRAWSNRDPGLMELLYDPLILRYRNDPRFAAFCKKVSLPTTTDAVAMK